MGHRGVRWIGAPALTERHAARPRANAALTESPDGKRAWVGLGGTRRRRWYGCPRRRRPDVRRGRIPPKAPPNTLDLAYRARRGCVRSGGTPAPDTSTSPTAADAAVF